MPVLRFLVAVVLGFVFSMVVVVAASLVLGGMLDTAILGVLQVVMWVLGTWSLLNSWGRRREGREGAAEFMAGRVLPDDASEGDVASSSTGAPIGSPAEPNASHQPADSVPATPTTARTGWTRSEVVGLIVAAMLVAGLAGGLVGSQVAAAPVTVISTTTTIQLGDPDLVAACPVVAAALDVSDREFEVVEESLEAAGYLFLPRPSPFTQREIYREWWKSARDDVRGLMDAWTDVVVEARRLGGTPRSYGHPIQAFAEERRGVIAYVIDISKNDRALGRPLEEYDPIGAEFESVFRRCENEGLLAPRYPVLLGS